jgi:hypothetical protein
LGGATSDRVARCGDLAKTDLDPKISEERVDKEYSPLWPALLGHAV